MKMSFKNIILILFVVFSTWQCAKNENQKIVEKEDITKRDSIKLENERLAKIEKAKQDSIIAIEQEKVIGSITFGISKSSFDREKQKFYKSCEKKTNIAGIILTDYFIGEYKYFQIVGSYYKNKLYEVFINGEMTNWKYYDSEVPKQIKNISGVISQKYGTPNLSYDLMPRYQLQEGYTYLINQWNIGDKCIEVRVEDSGTSYPVNVSIYKPEIREIIKKEKEEKNQKSTQAAKDIF